MKKVDEAGFSPDTLREIKRLGREGVRQAREEVNERDAIASRFAELSDVLVQKFRIHAAEAARRIHSKADYETALHDGVEKSVGQVEQMPVWEKLAAIYDAILAQELAHLKSERR